MPKIGPLKPNWESFFIVSCFRFYQYFFIRPNAIFFLRLKSLLLALLIYFNLLSRLLYFIPVSLSLMVFLILSVNICSLHVSYFIYVFQLIFVVLFHVLSKTFQVILDIGDLSKCLRNEILLLALCYSSRVLFVYKPFHLMLIFTVFLGSFY